MGELFFAHTCHINKTHSFLVKIKVNEIGTVERLKLVYCDYCFKRNYKCILT